MSDASGVRIELRGIVQGVGFRPWVHRLAHDTGIRGSVRNGSAGVTIDAFGSRDALAGFVTRLRRESPPAACIDALETTPLDGEVPDDFHIEVSRGVGPRRMAIGPDRATCPACLREVHDPQDRRHRYAFTNCTQCGPRLTIAESLPYDRVRTSMAPFEMCEACASEYTKTDDRRFHAEPNACPRCGPRLAWLDAAGEEQAAPDPIAAAAAALSAGHIVMLKGLGGFHLACDATSEAVVARLRERKARDAKPFAIMVADLAAAEQVAWLDDAERALLTSAERPIVLVAGRDQGVTRAVAPDCARLGIMLPYTPLHQLLLEEVGRPLVMTSANLADEPTVFRDADARVLLGSVADHLLSHDRRIVTRVDDSIAAVLGGAPVLLRRSRGWVPRPILLRTPVPEPILGCGAQLKNTFCIAVDDVAYLGPHIGDLDSLASYESFAESIARFEAMLQVEPRLVAHDLHPDLLSTRYALGREGRRVAVQHHHAHIASAVAEHQIEGAVVGVAFDGTGWGGDGTSWGGELLLVDGAAATRQATLRPMALAGGDRAVREPWRLALALLDDAFEGAPPLEQLGLFRQLEPCRIEQVRAVIRAGAPQSHGAGRYFDAVAALLLERPIASYEAQLAMALEQATDPRETAGYPFAVDETGAVVELDLRPTLRALVADVLRGEAVSRMATRFHHSLATGTAQLLSLIAPETPVVLSGGCFQNAVLTSRLMDQITPRRVFLQRQAPPNDGGIALGQIWVAALQGEE